MNAERNSTFSMIGGEKPAVHASAAPPRDPADRAAVPAEQSELRKPMHPRVRSAVAKLGLTQRESQIVEKFAGGMSTQALASELYISAATVRTHLRKIFTKLEISSRVELLSQVLAKVLDDIEESHTR